MAGMGPQGVAAAHLLRLASLAGAGAGPSSSTMATATLPPPSSRCVVGGGTPE